MKLISKHKDYYDFFARDRKISDQAYVWERHVRVVNVDFAIPDIVRSHTSHVLKGSKLVLAPNTVEVVGFLVWFCGAPVPALKVVRGPTECTGEPTTSWHYSLDDIADVDVGERHPRQRYGGKYRTTYQQLEELFALGKSADGTNGWMRTAFEPATVVGTVFPKVDVVEMHRRLKSPVFCHPYVIPEHHEDEKTVLKRADEGNYWYKKHYPGVVVNPRLAAIEFWKAVDSFEAFKSLERFVSNELAPRDARMDKPIPDVLKAQSHGFDKMSFRREPTRERQGRRKP